MNSAVMFSSATDEWSTPQAVFDDLDAEFRFAIDAAATATNTKCRLWLGDGGLGPDALAMKDWRTHDQCAIWLNPPYSKCRQFISRAAMEARQHSCTVVALVPARTCTRWWHEHVYDASTHQYRPGVEVRFVKGRLKFGGSKNSAPFPSAVIIFRPPS